MCSRGSPIWLGTRREPGRAGAKPGGAGRGGVPFAVGPGGVVDLGDPTHRGRKNHMDRSILCRRGLVNLISQEHSWLL